jgi:hypothetical protein
MHLRLLSVRRVALGRSESRGRGRLPRLTGWAAAAVMAASAAGGCEPSVVLVTPAAPEGEPGALTLVVDPELAERAGWTPGVPGTAVQVRRDESATILSLVTGESGELALEGLPAAFYWVWAEKHPTPAEREEPVLAPAALAGGAFLPLSRRVHDVLELRAQNDGSLVISEFYYHYPAVATHGTTNYQRHWYVELFNNADTTIYLDGKIVGAGFEYGLDAELWPCSETEPLRTDPRGIWANVFQAFPGSGTDYPLAPGEAVVIAEQAIDHGELYAGFPDLREAGFQFKWEGGAQNPAVPTMVPIQMRTRLDALLTGSGRSVPFVALPVDVSSLERVTPRFQGDFVLFPREVILDLAQIYNEFNHVRYQVRICERLVHPSLDALAVFRPYERENNHLLAVQRTVLPGGTRLQRTGVSAADFEIRLRSPGQVP